jgi:hypothetical protein
MTYEQTLEEELGRMIDRHGIAQVIYFIKNICRDKARLRQHDNDREELKMRAVQSWRRLASKLVGLQPLLYKIDDGQ